MTETVGESLRRRLAGQYDWVLLGTVFVLAAVGLANLYSATAHTPHAGKFESQILWLAIGAGVLGVVGRIDYRSWSRLAWPAVLVAVMVLLLLKLVSGDGSAGRWFFLGPLRVQPSELTKLVLIIASAKLLQDVSDRALRPGDVWLGLGALFVPLALVAVQPDLGTAIVSGLALAGIYVFMVRKLWPFWLASGALLLTGAVFWQFYWDKLERYQQNRITAFLNPESHLQDIGWQTHQSILAVGSGRVAGKGYLQATQSHFQFLPEYWTDFPFSVLAEEWGFLGGAVLLGLFAWLVLWMVHVAAHARDVFGSALCLGVAGLVFWQAVINIAMVLGFAPVVGLTLPFISYGGSSLLTLLVGVGLVSSVSSRRRGPRGS